MMFMSVADKIITKAATIKKYKIFSVAGVNKSHSKIRLATNKINPSESVVSKTTTIDAVIFSSKVLLIHKLYHKHFL